MKSALPYPPLAYMNRVGALPEGEALSAYDELGRLGRDFVLRHLPKDYHVRDKQILDFGCGAGRTLRHFIELGAPRGTLHGSDIHAPSIDWINRHLSPAASAVVTNETPPLPWADDSFDLIFGLSVFTHLAHHWSDWLIELHRVLRSDGILIVTFLGPEFMPVMFGQPSAQEALGMAVLRPYGDWELGGPMVVHSEWWIREHWGRAFDIVEMHPQCLAPLRSREAQEGPFQSCCVMTPRSGTWTPRDLEREADTDPRDFEALNHALKLSWLELRDAESRAHRLAEELERVQRRPAPCQPNSDE